MNVKPIKQELKNIKKNGHAQAKKGMGIAGLSDGLITAYQNGSLTQNQLAEQLGVSKNTVGKALKTRGITKTIAKTKVETQPEVHAKQDNRHNDIEQPSAKALPADFDLQRWIDRARDDGDVEDLQAELNTAFRDILKEDVSQLNEASAALNDYVKNGHHMWRSLQGMTVMTIKGIAKGQPAINLDGNINYATVEKLGKLARVLDLMHPNPIEHYRTVILPQQEALRADQSEELFVLRIETMTPEDVEEIQRQHECNEVN